MGIAHLLLCTPLGMATSSERELQPSTPLVVPKRHATRQLSTIAGLVENPAKVKLDVELTDTIIGFAARRVRAVVEDRGVIRVTFLRMTGRLGLFGTNGFEVSLIRIAPQVCSNRTAISLRPSGVTVRAKRRALSLV
jgi:hypothetical protein